VALCSFGDGAASAGATHEAMNLAGVQRLPVVFVCQNNGYAISVPQNLQMPIDSVARRAEAYGMPGVSVDGFDALAVYEATRDAVERARNGEGPSLIEARVQRMTPHSSQDDDTYRAEEIRQAAVAADPLPRLCEELIARGALDEAGAEAEAQRIRAEVVDAEQRALAEPEPDPERARQWLFAGDPPHPGICHG
jgi:2-oxoisovalerate dehydrogenase E1 component alpha subunit